MPISLDLNNQLQPETVVSVQIGDPGVSLSVANAVNPQQPGQFSSFIPIFCLVFSWVLTCVIVEMRS